MTLIDFIDWDVSLVVTVVFGVWLILFALVMWGLQR